MNKKIVGVLFCLIMLAAIPMAAGMQSDAESEDSLGLFGRTTVRGFILGSRTEGRITSFYALRVVYTTSSLFGEDESGVVMFQRISFTGKFTGHLGRFYVNGMFRGTI
jgi:hypothetical protein